MKKLFVIVAAVMVSTALFAQNEKKTETAPTPATAAPVAEKRMAHECYMMKDNALMHCMGTKAEAQKTDVKLKNGVTITAKGEVMKADGSKEMLANGQCIELNGNIGDCEKMHLGMKMEKKADDKMMEAKPAPADVK
ncbi:MAG TPA: DUF6799 domain-containing protein [Bacteroidia bacterium]|nr:DUF6799 domain-containing protein [Bacteroidia bacterium]